jgi:hypothetical protein
MAFYRSLLAFQQGVGIDVLLVSGVVVAHFAQLIDLKQNFFMLSSA